MLYHREKFVELCCFVLHMLDNRMFQNPGHKFLTVPLLTMFVSDNGKTAQRLLEFGCGYIICPVDDGLPQSMFAMLTL